MGNLAVPFVFVRKFDPYKIAYSPEATLILGKPHYFTLEAYVYFIGQKLSNRYVFVEKGFFSDGSSTPALFQGVLPVWGPHGHAVLLHDKLCKTGYCLEVNERGEVRRVKLTRKEIDDIFLEAMRVVDVSKAVINLASLGFKVHRGLMNPPVPNYPAKEEDFQKRYHITNNITNIREEQVPQFLKENLVFAFNERSTAVA